MLRWARSLIARAAGRHPDWPEVRDAFVKAHPTCAACGKRAGLEVHHVIPFHLSSIGRARELDPTNLQTLCRRCHLLIGHLDNWRSWNPEARADAARMLWSVQNRPKERYE